VILPDYEKGTETARFKDVRLFSMIVINHPGVDPKEYPYVRTLAKMRSLKHLFEIDMT
jgi:hypothetical protein